MLLEILTDILKEKQPDGRLKWSYFRILGALWFVLAVMPSVVLYWCKVVDISPEITPLSGVFILGIVGGKVANGLTAVFQNKGTSQTP